MILTPVSVNEFTLDKRTPTSRLCVAYCCHQLSVSGITGWHQVKTFRRKWERERERGCSFNTTTANFYHLKDEMHICLKRTWGTSVYPTTIVFFFPTGELFRFPDNTSRTGLISLMIKNMTKEILVEFWWSGWGWVHYDDRMVPNCTSVFTWSLLIAPCHSCCCPFCFAGHFSAPHHSVVPRCHWEELLHLHSSTN